MKNNTQARNEALDGLRGFCAIAVMLVHFSHFNGMTWFKNAGAAVDAFFIISGFVMTQSYQSRILNGYTLANFAFARALRLMPINLLTSTLGLAAVVLFVLQSTYAGKPDSYTLVRAYLLSIIFIPNFNGDLWPFGSEMASGGLFPLNLPTWSLFYEWIAYIVFYFVTKYLRQFLLQIWILSVVAYVSIALIFQYDNPGWNEASLWQGIFRVLFGFFTGVMIRISYDGFKSRNRIVLWCLPFVAVLLLLFGDARFSLINTFLFVPATVKLLAELKTDAGWARICSYLGALSFPLYMIHVPVATVVYTQFGLIKALSPVGQIAFLSALSVGLAYVLNLIDVRVRQLIYVSKQ